MRDKKRMERKRVVRRRNPDLEEMSKIENTGRKTFNCSY